MAKKPINATPNATSINAIACTHGSQGGNADAQHAQHVQCHDAIAGVRTANNADANQYHRQKQDELTDLDNDGEEVWIMAVPS